MLSSDLLVMDTLIPSATSQLLESQDKGPDPKPMAVLLFGGNQAEMKFNHKVSLVTGEPTQKLNSWSQKLKPSDADSIASRPSSLQEQSRLAVTQVRGRLSCTGGRGLPLGRPLSQPQG